MIRNLFDVVALDDDCTRWACQRELEYGVFETIGNFEEREEACIECDLLNEDVETEAIEIEQALAIAYGFDKGGAA